ncbi:site-specific integrase [Mucilaginibacter gilvus]|uniref:Site-specific integrase n=1 Tax=Mucilaginibacter gilvus TaxID=2305909 RepID=A0A3S3YU36_9SPHI|nr:site-specific integrase [Mucilaginibacter gilvus]RWY46065.1 site-specific integrase [Mucilaginibacter gilvus]
MLEKSFGLLFFMRKPKNYQAGMLPIYLKITVDGQPKELSAKRKWDPTKWSTASGRALGTKEESKELNYYLCALEQKVYEAKKLLMETNKPITAIAIKNILTGHDESRKMILELFKRHNEQMKVLTGTDFAPGTIERYNTSYEHTKEFIRWKYKACDKEIKELDYEFIEQYAFWLKAIRKCNHNTTMKYLGNFKKIVLICVKNKWLPGDPFANFKLTKKEVERTALTDIELKRIINKNFESERITQVKDMFLFSCYTGLSYVDLQQLKKTDIGLGADGAQWIFTKRQKTKISTNVPLLKAALNLLSKYSNHPKCSVSNLAFPVLTNQKMNAYLKEIADCCGIKMNLTFHIARHTFATTVTLSNGVPIESVSKMLGHSNLLQTQHYAKTLDLKISHDMNQLKRKYDEMENH